VEEKDGTVRLNVLALTVDHKPGDPKEKERIAKAGGRVGLIAPGLPLRVFRGIRNTPGLAVSRSIGDQWTEDLGVTADPDLFDYTLSDRDEFAVFGSDGVWEFLPNEQVASIVWRNRTNPQQAARELVEEAKTKWIRQTNAKYTDDITCVIVFFKTPPKPIQSDDTAAELLIVPET